MPVSDLEYFDICHMVTTEDLDLSLSSRSAHNRSSPPIFGGRSIEKSNNTVLVLLYCLRVVTFAIRMIPIYIPQHAAQPHFAAPGEFDRGPSQPRYDLPLN